MAESTGFLERFRDVVAQHPEQIAVVTGGNQFVSYRELLNQAEKIAAGLLEANVQPEQLIGLGLTRSAEWIATMIACWQSATAFVPIDTRWPAERLEYILRDSGIRLAIANEPLASELTRLGITLVIASTSDDVAINTPGYQPNRLAYAIYTSGSTGYPKGVLVEHRGIVNLIDEQIKSFQLKRGSRSLWMLSPAFDASLSDVGTALLAGATLYIEPEESLRDPVQLIDLLNRYAITHIDLPPVLLRILDSEAIPASLQTVVIGGEPASADAVRSWAKKVRVVNVYGPTEATVCTSLGVCHPETWHDPLLGQPIAGIRYEVLDEELNPVPVGGIGELYLTGVGLARGYLNRSELTTNKFPTIRKERWYRTSDRVWYRQDGEYVFLGRMDRQFKILGQLVEPAEVEARLLELTEVREAAVVRRGTGNREKIVAVVVLKDQAMSKDKMRVHLVGRIPPWMVPHQFEILAALPRTTAGKVDYVALEGSQVFQPEAEFHELDDGASVEAALLSIWSSILGRRADSQFGFYEQGGDSLGVFQIVVAAHARGIKLRPSQIAEGLTVSMIASRLRTESPRDALPADYLEKEAFSQLTRLQTPSPDRNSVARNPGRILLTGATGFLGQRLLSELLSKTSADIACLVRGVRRLQPHPRVREISCDMELPNFGLSRLQWDELSRQIDAIYHCAAAVDLIRPYHQLRAANLDATATLLELLGSGKPKCLHYASTLSVFVATDSQQKQFEEIDDLSSTGEVYGGYAQTKWAAERLLRLAQGRFGPVVHYRFGFISGDTNSGRGPDRDLLTHFLRGLVQIGGYPEGVDNLCVDLTPVDYAAAAMAHLSLGIPRDGMTFHLANPRGLRFAELIEALTACDVKLESMLFTEFADRAAKLSPLASASCLALCRSHPGDNYDQVRAMDLFQATHVRFDQTNTLACLAGSELYCPLPDPQYIRKLVVSALRGTNR